jgi:hypothetical protein
MVIKKGFYIARTVIMETWVHVTRLCSWREGLYSQGCCHRDRAQYSQESGLCSQDYSHGESGLCIQDDGHGGRVLSSQDIGHGGRKGQILERL